MTADFRNLSARQRSLIDQWLPDASVEKDHGWGLVDTTVLEVDGARRKSPVVLSEFLHLVDC